MTAAQILDWADEFKARTGRWPTRKDGRVSLTDNTWSGLDACLKGGCRGLNPGSSLAKLLLVHRGRRHKKLLPPLTSDLILDWADAYHDRTGDWPTQYSGPVVDAPGETWSGINCALNEGGRSHSGGSSIAQLLEAHRGVRNHLNLPPLTPSQILIWADAHHARTGRWPRKETDTGPIPEAPGEAWEPIDQALLVGVRGLPGGSSLAQLLAAERGVRNPADLPRLEHWEILGWADDYFDRTGQWPTAASGAIPEAPGETWSAVDSALWAGSRGLPGEDSLARLLARRRGVCNRARRPRLTTAQILAWADAHRRRTGAWPTARSGPVDGIAGETWCRVARALHRGSRGLSGGSSLARLLEAKRGVSNPAARRTQTHDGKRVARARTVAGPLTEAQILAWADAHHARTGAWPRKDSGPIPEASEEWWSAVAAALETGCRGLPDGGSLARLLAQHRGVRNHMALPPITVEQILDWADEHHGRTGEWPTGKGGPIPEASGDTWKSVEMALLAGLRGLSGGDTLARLLARERGKRNRKALPHLSVEQIREWVRAHHRRTGEWPARRGGPIPDAPGETWCAVDQALSHGLRGLSGGSSLPKVVRECHAIQSVPL